MKFPIITTTAAAVILLSACGGGGSSSSDNSSQTVEIPASIIIDSVALEAGVPMGTIVTLSKPADPYTEINIDIGRTLENANITVSTQ